MLTSPPDAQWVADVNDEVREVLALHGSEAGHYSILSPDPWRVIWNRDRSGFVGFLEARGVILTWRSPVASRDEQPELLEALWQYAQATHRHLFGVPANETMAQAARDMGMSVIWMGTECFVDLPTWSTAGGRRQKVRWALNHARNLGFTWREAYPVRDERDFLGLALVEEAWKAERRERRTDSFLRTSFLELADLRRYFVCEGPDGVVASVTCTPINARGWYLQDPVRDPHAPRGALEGAMALALDTFRDEGFETASNGPLPFWHPADHSTDNRPLGPVANRVLHYFDQRYHFQQINQFRSKITPDRVEATYLVRSHRYITPTVATSLIKLLTRPAQPTISR